jgi:hypothetical protein
VIRFGQKVFILLFIALMIDQAALAQSRPLATEDPETVPAGDILFEAGFDLSRSAVFPLSGLTGTLTRIGVFGFSFGVSSIAEIQIDGGVRNRLAIVTRDPSAPLAEMLVAPNDSTSDFEDFRIGAKIRFASETASRPAMAVRFATKLPNAGNESGLGTDTTDFHFGFALGKTVRSVRTVANVGFAILPDAVRGDRQNDVLEFGVSVARAVRPGVEFVGELNGRRNTRTGMTIAGTESRGAVRIGARATRGAVRGDAALVLGVTEYDPSWGIAAGLTWVFRGFDVP